MKKLISPAIPPLLLLAVLSMLVIVGCAAKNPATAHPNQLNTFDGEAYDSLTIAQGVLDEAKKQYADGKLPVTAKAVINATGTAYNTATTAWLGYRDIVSGKQSGDAAQAQSKLQTDLNTLNTNVAQLKTITGGK